MNPTPGRIVLYLTRDGYDFPALVTAVVNPAALPALAPGHIHLKVFSPPWGLVEGQDEINGTPQAPPSGPIPPGTWRWPERVS